jgi:hypothetical protein
MRKQAGQQQVISYRCILLKYNMLISAQMIIAQLLLFEFDKQWIDIDKRWVTPASTFTT